MLLKRHDEKFVLIRKYQEFYNSFIDGNSDMLEDESTKEELH